MSDRKVWTIAIWSVEEGRWVAGLTSEVRPRVEAVFDVMRALIPSAFVVLVESRRDDVELIEANVAALPLVSALDVYCSLLEAKDFVEEEAQAMAREGYAVARGLVRVH